MLRARKAARIGLAASVVAFSQSANAAEVQIEDFESAASPAPWVFSKGPEYPGAAGSLSSGPGHSGKGAHLAYDFSGGGLYVGATLSLVTPLTATAIDVWVRSDPGIHPAMRVIDATGQTLQYEHNRPLSAFDPAAWYRQVIDLDESTSHSGGANDGAVHQPISSISILAADPIEPGASGSIDFDDLGAIDVLAPSIDPASDQVLPPPAGSDSLATRLGVQIHFTNDDAALDLARGLGFSWVRTDLGWSRVETRAGVYDFSALDGLLAALAQRNMHLLLTLDFFNSLYPAAGASNFASVTVPAFAAVVKSAAAHFAGKGVRFEVWNEPNNSTFWPPAPNPTQYGELCKAGVAALHQGDPSATVTTGGLSQFDFSFLRASLDAGAGPGADAVGVHPYRMNGGEEMSGSLLLMRSIVARALTPTTQVWDTEWGYSATWFGSGTDATARAMQAQFATREVLSVWALGFPIAIYYDLRDDGTDPSNAEDNFGLVQSDNTDKPAARAVRTLTSIAKGRTLAGSLPVEPDSIKALRLDGPDDWVVPLWTTVDGGTFTVQVPRSATAVDEFGASIPLRVDGGGSSVTLRRDDGPVYVTLAHPASSSSPLADAGSGASTAGDAAVVSGASFVMTGDAGASASAQSSSGCGCVTARDRGSRAPGDALLAASLLVVVVRARRRNREGRAARTGVGARVQRRASSPSPPRGSSRAAA
jgi:hypothetical protein